MADPDTWWQSLPPERREQVYRWVEQPTQPESASQGEIFDIVTPPPPPPRHRHIGGRLRW